jgi:dienelactone hydrolase
VLEALSEADSPFLGGSSVYPDLHDTTPIPAPHHRVLLVQGAKDLTAPLARAHSFAERAWSAGAALRLKVYEGEGHGWQAAETLVDYYEEVHKFTSGV